VVRNWGKIFEENPISSEIPVRYQPKNLEDEAVAMNEVGLNRLRALDWDEVTAKLMLAAITKAVRYGWTPKSSLPGGKSIQDVVAEAIADIWNEPDRLNPAVDIPVQLNGIVRHKLWNLSQSRDEDVRRAEDLNKSVTVIASGPKSVDTGDEFQRAIELLQASPKVKGNDDLEFVVLAISCGAWEVDELVRETGLSRERIYQLRRELRAIYPTIAGQLRGKEQQS
jgi:hypothetical protein